MVGQQPPTTMPGTVRRTPTGWLADVSVNGTRRTGLCKTKAEALARKRELLEALVNLDATPAGLSLFSLKDARQLSLQVRWAGTAGERTAAIYSQAVLDHFGAHTLLSEITAAGVDAWRRKLLSTGNRPATINKKVSALKAMLADAHLRGHLATVPKLPPQLKLQNTKDRVFSDQEVALFCHWFQQAGHPAAADLLVFLLETAARWGEAEALKGDDVDLVKARVTFSKTKANRVRSVPLTRRALQALEDHMPAVGAHKVWPYTYAQFRRLLQSAKEAIGLGDDDALNLHCTRHTCASKLATSGIPLHQIMTWGGWSSLASVQRYIHLQTDALSACVAALEQK
jgi:integrase